MYLVRMTAVFTLLFAASVYGQQIESVAPSGSGNATPAVAEPSARSDAPAPQLIMDATRGQNDADARECLQLGTNTEIHRCAEKYRSHTGGNIVKTGQKTGKAKADTPKASDPPSAAGTSQTMTAQAAGGGNARAAVEARSTAKGAR